MQLPSQIAALVGQERQTSAAAAANFAHEEEPLPVLFVEPSELAGHLVEAYMDETDECLAAADGSEWTDASLVPFAAIAYGGTGFEDGDLRYVNAFAYLFWDATREVIVWTTTDCWDRDNTLTSLAELGIDG